MLALNWARMTLSQWSLGAIVLAIAIVGFFVYSYALARYRMQYHPLAKYPGPFWARITPFPAAVALLRGRLPFWQKACHDKYGPIVRIAPNELSFDEERAWKDIYGSRPGHKNFQKDPIHVGSIAAVHGASTITMANDMDHARQRRALSHAFSTKALLEQEYIVMNYVNVFSDRMREFANGDGNDDFRFWVPLISNSIKAGAIEQATRRIATTGSLLQRFLQWCIPGNIAETRLQHLNYSREKILKRMEQKSSEHRDFLYYVMKQQDKGDLNANEVIVNGALFIIAGTETTAGFLTGLFNLLTQPENTHILSTLTKEIRDAFAADIDMNFQALNALPYLGAVIDEGLRMFPSAPIGFTRSVPDGGDTVCGEFLPAHTTVSVCMWAATKSLRNFDSPYEFRPERWLDREGSVDKLSASNAFSLGPRGCIGKHLAYMEMRLIIGKLLWWNDVERVKEMGNEIWNPAREYENMTVYTNWSKKGLKVRLRARKDM
ncbi:cytochrome P450 [Phaeosphaeriaceae sp. SRC1lsM3a]|nr:cytochrome P450 [Stagonospora sp. SRC1lsM3a]